MAVREESGGQPHIPDWMKNRRITRRAALIGAGSLGLGAAGFAASQVLGKGQETNSPKEEAIGVLQNPSLLIEALPNGQEQMVLGNAEPANLVVRRGSKLAVRGLYKDEATGAESVLFSVTDPLRKNPDESDKVFSGIIPLSLAEGQADTDVSFASLLTANGGAYDKEKGVVSFKEGSRGRLEILDPGTIVAERIKRGAFFVDVDPLKKDHPLLQNPLVPKPEASVVGINFSGSINQLEDGRVVAMTPEGAPIARAMLLRNGEWMWTKKEHLVSDYSISEFANALDFTVSGFGLAQNLTKAQYVEAYLSLFNKMKISDAILSKKLFSASIDWRKILDNWEDVQTQFANGQIPYEREVLSTASVGKVNQLIQFAEKYNIPTIGQNLFWWNYNIDAIFSNDYSPADKKKMFEFMVKAKVLKFPKIKEWVVASEVAETEMTYFDPKWRALFASVGGRQIIHDVSVWALQMNPVLALVFMENHTTDVSENVYQQIRDDSDDLLRYYQAKGTPFNKVAVENNFWIYAPPKQGEIKARYQKIQSMGYKVGASEMVVSASARDPGYKNRQRTVSLVSNIDEAQAKINIDAVEAALDVGAEFGLFSGTDADTWHNYEGYTDSQPEILDTNYNDKLAAVGIKTSLKKRLAA